MALALAAGCSRTGLDTGFDAAPSRDAGMDGGTQDAPPLDAGQDAPMLVDAGQDAGPIDASCGVPACDVSSPAFIPGGFARCGDGRTQCPLLPPAALDALGVPDGELAPVQFFSHAEFSERPGDRDRLSQLGLATAGLAAPRPFSLVAGEGARPWVVRLVYDPIGSPVGSFGFQDVPLELPVEFVPASFAATTSPDQTEGMLFFAGTRGGAPVIESARIGSDTAHPVFTELSVPSGVTALDGVAMVGPLSDGSMWLAYRACVGTSCFLEARSIVQSSVRTLSDPSFVPLGDRLLLHDSGAWLVAHDLDETRVVTWNVQLDQALELELGETVPPFSGLAEVAGATYLAVPGDALRIARLTCEDTCEWVWAATIALPEPVGPLAATPFGEQLAVAYAAPGARFVYVAFIDVRTLTAIDTCTGPRLRSFRAGEDNVVERVEVTTLRHDDGRRTLLAAAAVRHPDGTHVVASGAIVTCDVR